MDKKNLLVIAAVLIAAAVLLGASALMGPRVAAEEDLILITVDGREYARVPLSKPQTVTVRQESGAENIVVISDRGAVMHSSTCDNQLCVQMGEVTVDNWEYRPNQQFIICLPNRVSIELVVTE
ncbi:MAG: NusG domain II-containing protein [Clostridia bacterium]|nr:NusG domain II-containing protein [Clostridia bacterium]